MSSLKITRSQNIAFLIVFILSVQLSVSIRKDDKIRKENSISLSNINSNNSTIPMANHTTLPPITSLPQVEEKRWNTKLKEFNCSLLDLLIPVEGEDETIMNNSSSINRTESWRLERRKNATKKLSEDLDKHCTNSNDYGGPKGELSSILMCSLHNRTLSKNNSQDYEEFNKHYIHAVFTELCPNFNQSNDVEDFGELVKFLFEVNNTKRSRICDTLGNRMKINLEGCGELRPTWGEICKDEDPYQFSWQFLSAISDTYKNGSNRIDFFQNTDRTNWSEQVIPLVDGSRFKDARLIMHMKNWMRNELVLKFLTSNLLLNNFGRGLKQAYKFVQTECDEKDKANRTQNENKEKKTTIKHLKIECDTSILWQRKPGEFLGRTDLKLLVDMEAYYSFFHFFLICLGLSSNLYVSLALKVSLAQGGGNQLVTKTNKTSSTLIAVLLASNFVFLAMNILNLVVGGGTIIEFPAISDYDGDLFAHETFLVALSTLRMIIDSGWFWKSIMVFENLFLNLSRTVASTVIFLIMCFVLYELRTSFCGRIREETASKVRRGLILWCSIVALLYLIIFIINIRVINSIGELLRLATDGEKMEKYNSSCTDLKNHYEVDEFFLQSHILIMEFFSIATVICLVGLFAYHKLKEITAQFPIPVAVLDEMHIQKCSLLLSTATYILSNSGVIFVEMRLMFMDNCKEKECISNPTIRYHWLYLLCLLDPIVQPIVILFRMRSLKRIHRRWYRIWINLNSKEMLKEFIRWGHTKMFTRRSLSTGSFVDLLKTSFITSPQIRQNQNHEGKTTMEKFKIKSIICEDRRKVGVKIIENDLQSMLHHLEEERNVNVIKNLD